MRVRLAVAAFTLLWVAHACADFTPRNWRFRKAVEGPDQPGFYALQLDPQVLAGADLGLSDLRLIASDGSERPYELRTESAQQSVEPVTARLYNLSRVPDLGTRFELDLGTSEEMTSQITIDSSSADFRYQVTVEGSPEGRRWAILREGGAIFDFRGDVSARSMMVLVPQTNFRYLRVTIHDTGERPLKVTGATVAREVVRPARLLQLRPFETHIATDATRRATDVYVDLGLGRQPCSRAVVRFGDDNVRRQCEVSYRNDASAKWLPAGSGVIFRYHTTTFTGEQTVVEFGEVRARQVRVSVLNGDDVPLKVTGAKLYGIPRTIVFEWDPGQHVELYYGADGARWPQYDLSTFLRYEQVVPRTGLSLGPQQDNPDYRPPRKPWTEERPWLLWTAIALAVILVGAMIVRMMAKVGEGPPAGA